MRSDAPAGSPKQYTDPKTIDSLLKSSDPEAVAESGRSYQKFAAAYEKIAGELIAMRSDLHDAWGGQDAAAAQGQLREVWAAATTVHKIASTFGIVVERHGSESLAWYKNNKPPSKNLADAQSWMTGANERVSQSWGSLPPDLSTTLPAAGPGRGGYQPTSNGHPGSGSQGGMVSGGSTQASGNMGSSTSHVSDQNIQRSRETSSGVGGEGSNLAGFSPGGAAATAPLGGGTYGSGGGFGPSLGGTGGTSIGVGGSSPILPGGGFVPGGGSSDVRGVNPGGQISGRSSAAAAREAQAAETNVAARTGMTGPMVGGAGADRDEKERERQAWLAEEEETWTGELQTTPQVIGGGITEAQTLEPSGEGDEGNDAVALAAQLRSKLEELELQIAKEEGKLVEGEDGVLYRDWVFEEDG
jgi:hypothetical protein